MNDIEDMVTSLEKDDMIGAKASFEYMLNQKITDAIDQKRIEVADSIYNSMESDTDDINIDDITDEEIENGIAETEDNIE